jgi:hypothetical protein
MDMDRLRRDLERCLDQAVPKAIVIMQQYRQSKQGAEQ